MAHPRALRRAALACALPALLWLLAACAGQAPLPQVRIQAELKPNGDLAVTQEIAYDIAPSRQGALTQGLTHTLYAQGDGEIADISITARLADGQSVTFARDDDAAPGDTAKFSLRAADGRAVLSLYHPMPRAGGRQTVIYRYTLPGLARRYSDSGALDWDALGPQGWDRGIADFSLRVALPLSDRASAHVTVPTAPPQAQWGHSTDGLALSARNVAPGQRVRAQLDFPAAVLPYQPFTSRESLADLRAAQAAKQDRAAILGAAWAGASLLVLGGLLLWQRGRTRRAAYSGSLPRGQEPLLGITAPAELSALTPLARSAGAEDMVAMLLHLIHRNHLALLAPPPGLPLCADTLDQARVVRLPGPRDTLLDGEFFLIHWLIDLVGDGKSVSLGQMRRAPRAGFGADYRSWRRLVNRQIAQRPWFADVDAERTALALPGCTLVAGTLAMALLGAAPWAWLGLPAGAALVACARRLRRLAPAAQRETLRWQGLRQQLLDGPPLRVETIAQWERILLYAQAMGIGQQAAQAMLRDGQRGSRGMPWPDAREATYLAWPLLEYADRLPEWFALLCQAVAAPAVTWLDRARQRLRALRPPHHYLTGKSK
ncbi:MAG: DUF2207 domain-containing protein [Oscillospiraceae bacterium]|nr:DUF2207 domain-containing protein [Oscillospiraceae bacterium]